MHSNELIDFSRIYQQFNASISVFDCGEKCAPHNERAIPFCCDIQHTVPSAYEEEWDYLKPNTDLWRELKEDELENFKALNDDVPPGQLLIACKGHHFCQRNFRAITCRSFPFFPYINNTGDFLGLSYYWEYEDLCWIISNLNLVTPEFINSFVTAFDYLLRLFPFECESFRYQSIVMQKEFARMHRTITLIHRNGHYYKISPKNGRMRKLSQAKFPKFGPYKIAQGLPFPDELKTFD